MCFPGLTGDPGGSSPSEFGSGGCFEDEAAAGQAERRTDFPVLPGVYMGLRGGVLVRTGAAGAWPLPVSPLLYFFRSLSFSSWCQEQPAGSQGRGHQVSPL